MKNQLKILTYSDIKAGTPEEHPGLISFRMDWLDLPAVQGTLKSLFQQDRKSVV